MGGEAYITFKPGLIDADGTVTDEAARGFLKAFIDQFAALVARSATPCAPRRSLTSQNNSVRSER